ncbi:ABC transporter ATP-binding protein [Paenibacillus sp. GCM10012307]|uniref:ABC transporter ATP-binding protein n=1 Tax=Paenibacillus roseus TaxID=2798579 RepID=A0A934J8X7_9BACL|nr:ABC transporter ATP-binding protein [Paenibacillus roseus]MBJ6363753.1 ABC transporter ATP-binding protein [Paenibacillus roseus]
MNIKNKEKQKVSQQTSVNWRTFYHVLKETRPPKLTLGLAIFLSIVTTLAGLIVPLLLKGLVDGFSEASLSASHIGWIGAAFLAQALAGGLSAYLLNRSGQHMVAGIRRRLWSKLLVLPVPYYDKNRTGETVSRMTNDTNVVRTLISDHLTNFATGLVAIAGSVTLMLVLDWKMTLVLLSALPVTMFVMIPLGRKMHRISKGLQDETAKFSGVLNQVLMEIRLVKLSGSEKIEQRNGEGGIKTLYGFGLKEARIQAMIGPLMSFVMMAMLVVIIGYGGMRVASGALSAGDLVAFILYLVQIIMPVGQITQFVTQLQKARGATERIVDTLGEAEEDFAGGVVLENPQRPITLEGVTFAYEEKEPVLDQVNFVIDPGKVTAIVGPSGSGKTTLFSLLERFYLPQEGVIRIGDEPISTYTLTSWRSAIGYVSQESPILAGTIRDNIIYGLEREVSDDELKEAARLAYADQFIEAFPGSYNTEVGERGIKLSGGQRQRIGIARALLRNPSILMLDEATSSLDSNSEKYVQLALETLMKGRTTLVIAHRLSTVINADRIVFLDNGKVTGTGTHEELLDTHELYREFAQRQLHINGVTSER